MSAFNLEKLADDLATMKAEIAAKAATSSRVLDEYRALITQQQRCFDEDRRCWEQERQEMRVYIAALEYNLIVYQSETQNKDVKPEKPYEVWRGTGGQSSARSAKSVLDPPSDTFKPEGRLRTKEGKVPSESYKAPFVMGTGISVPNKADFEGINFKENIRAPPIAESLMASQLASPLRFQSPTRGIPPAGAKPSSLLAAPPILPSTDPEHEPSTSQAIAKADSSAVSSSLVTPIYTDPEKSAQEPHPSAVKLPSERAPEHVPRLEPDRDGGDSELRGPLSLKNNNLEDNSFLRELDSKLREAAKSMPAEEPDKPKDNSKDNVGSRQPQSQPEHEMELEPEPELQFKGSMNFGSPFGAPYCGKGI